MAKSKYIETLQEQYTKKDGKSVLRYKAPDNKWRYIQSSTDPESGGSDMPSGGGMTETTWADLRDLRDNGQLVVGSLYRITDYQCTTTQENTRSAGHQFDIILLALSEDKLAEEGWAMEHPTDIYDVTFQGGIENPKTVKKCYIYCIDIENNQYNIVDCDTLLGISGTNGEGEDFIIDEINKTCDATDYSVNDLIEENLTYNYFCNSNLSAWKVWYCLDNDTDRFAWADDTYKLNPASIICDCYNYGTGTKVDGPIDYVGKQFVNGTIYYRDEENDTTIPFMGNAPAYAWTSENDITIFTTSVSPNSLSKIYSYATTGLGMVKGDGNMYYLTTSYVEGLPNYDFPNGRGVIYRLIDEWNNDVAYDFKNIQYELPMTEGLYDYEGGTLTWLYTFNNGGGEAIDNSINGAVGGNFIEYVEYLPIIVFTGEAFNNKFIKSSECINGMTENSVLINCSGITQTSEEGTGLAYNTIYINDRKVLTET